MNKELILKYKKEFDYWVNGGKILMHYGKWVPVSLDAKWEFFISDLEIIGSFGYIIDDKYVEFRKALAEGKTIQFNFGNFGPNKTDFPNVWKDLDLSIGILSDRALPENYRIKPKHEESKFKVGDWVTEQGVILQIPEPINEECLTNHLTLYERRCKKWEPLVGEVHWFARNKDEEPVLGKFVETRNWRGITTYAIYTSTDSDATCRYFEYCEPHIGTLPTKWRNK